MVHSKKVPLLSLCQVDGSQTFIKINGGIPRQNMEIHSPNIRIVCYFRHRHKQLFTDPITSISGLDVEILQ